MIKPLRFKYPTANIVAVDYDPGASEVNQLNRIKLMMSVAFKNLKVTQDNLPAVWRYVPKQDFTSSSDIDWSKSIHEIDLQLYRKYGLDKTEIEFIESHVKEMA